MKTLSFELSKRLHEAGLLDDAETEYGYEFDINGPYPAKRYEGQETTTKTLTLEEAIDFLPQSTVTLKCKGFYRVLCPNSNGRDFNSQGKTLLEAIEQMITYLLDNNLGHHKKQ